MKNKENIVVFCAHADDEIFGPGATLAKYAKEGKNIYTYIFSHGEKSLAWLKENIAIKTRIKEAEKADKLIKGKKVEFLGIADTKIKQEVKEKKTEDIIKKIIKKIKPTKIFTHSPEDAHPDHRAISNAIVEIADKIKYKGDVYAFDVWNPFSLKKSYLPKMYVDVTGTFNIKIKALRLFKSQKCSLLALFWSVIAGALIHGSHIHVRYAERFFKLR